MNVGFVKMHGLGNHFIFFDELRADFSSLKKPEIIRILCDVRHGLGADGVVFVMNPSDPAHQCRMQMFNVDGTEAEMCGNAIRCVAHQFQKHHGDASTMAIETRGGLRIVRSADPIDGVDYYQVDMGKPGFDLVATGELLPEMSRQSLTWGGEELHPDYANVGNPHAVLFLDSQLSDEEMRALGPWLEMHPNHPRRINIEFAEVLGPRELRIHIWERGCGMTAACGTGATASAGVAIKTGRVASPVTVHMPGGDLFISQEKTLHLFMTGPVQEVAEGTLSQGFVERLLSESQAKLPQRSQST